MTETAEIAKAGVKMASKIYDDSGWFRTFLIISGFHDEAAKMSEVMALIESIGVALQESQNRTPANETEAPR